MFRTWNLPNLGWLIHHCLIWNIFSVFRYLSATNDIWLHQLQSNRRSLLKWVILRRKHSRDSNLSYVMLSHTYVMFIYTHVMLSHTHVNAYPYICDVHNHICHTLHATRHALHATRYTPRCTPHASRHATRYTPRATLHAARFTARYEVWPGMRYGQVWGMARYGGMVVWMVDSGQMNKFGRSENNFTPKYLFSWDQPLTVDWIPKPTWSYPYLVIPIPGSFNLHTHTYLYTYTSIPIPPYRCIHTASALVIPYTVWLRNELRFTPCAYNCA